MIAFAITCLLVATVVIALLVASDSAFRGLHSYRALASELRALRAASTGQNTSIAHGCSNTRPAQPRPVRAMGHTRSRTNAGGMRAAA